MSYEHTTKALSLVRAEDIQARVQDDGCVILEGCLPPERGARFLKALRIAEEEVRQAYRLLGRSPPPNDTLRAEALVWMVEYAMGADEDDVDHHGTDDCE